MNTDLHDAFLDQLADMLSAEEQLIQALPKMAKLAQSEELREAITAHLAETELQAERLQEVAQSLDEKLRKEKCKAMQGLIAEASDLAETYKDTAAGDAAIIAAAQKVEHYEIATYGTLCAWAEEMGHDEALTLLQESLDEEKAANEKLTSIAESSANEEAQKPKKQRKS